MLTKQVKFHEFNGQRVVHSWELYHLTGLKRMNYSRWIQWNVLGLGKAGEDYFPTPGNVQGRTLRFRLRFYLTINFAIGLCFLAKRKEAQEVRRFLLENNK